MNKLNRFLMYALAGLCLTFTACNDDDVVPTFNSNFEELSFPAEADAYYGQDKTGEKTEVSTGTDEYSYNYTSGKATYNLSYIVSEQYGNWWNGVAYSKQTDNTQEGLAGQFVAMPGKGANNSTVYAVMNGGDTIRFTEGAMVPQNIQLTNNAYAYQIIKNGNQFSKKFGGVDGTDPDFFKVTITGVDAQGNASGSVEFYLADYRSEDSSKDYIVDSWELVDLSSLGEVEALAFSYESSDVGDYGINTPLYVAFDELVTQMPTVE